MTSLVNEAYLKLTDKTGQQWSDRNHFLRVAAKAMRQITVDYVRAKLTEKRGQGQSALPIDNLPIAGDRKPQIIVAMEEGLQQLAETQPRLVEVVECRFFAGLTIPETASVLGVSKRTVVRDWEQARHWMREYLT